MGQIKDCTGDKKLDEGKTDKTLYYLNEYYFLNLKISLCEYPTCTPLNK